MRTVIVGAGPTGLYLGIALARRGHPVTIVDRDHGPAADGTWPRRGVMQFHHPHGFRGHVIEALLAEMPDVWDDLQAAGAEPVIASRGPAELLGFRSRRLTVERVLRAAAERQTGLDMRIGHADAILAAHGRAAGVRVDGVELEADLVLDASGRAGRLTRDLRGPADGGDCGIAYVSRQYRLRPGAEPGQLDTPILSAHVYPGYGVLVFPHDNGVFSTLITRSGDDRELAALRHTDAFDAAVRAVPLLAEWTDPQRSAPFTDVLPGGRLYNSYQGQLDEAGRVALPGVLFVGDAVCTTNPVAGRGVTTSLLQARELLRLLEEHPGDPAGCSQEFDRWCAAHIRPWFDDHARSDTDQLRRWSGGDVELDRPLPSSLIVAATQVDPSMMAVVSPYLGMRALPDSLAAVEPRAREIYADGWRPPVPAGPTRDELAELVTAA